MSVIKKADQERFDSLKSQFHDAFVKCERHGIFISPECVTDKVKWRIVIEKRDGEGNVKEYKLSDPVFYFSKFEYQIKVMELTIFYANKV